MFEDSEATSDRTLSVRMGSDDDLSSPRLESMLKGLLVSDREFASDPPFEGASPSRRHPREIVLPND